MIEAETPDGVVHEFPDGTSRDVIDAAVKGYIASNKQPGTPAYSDPSGEFGPPTGGEKGYSSVKEALAPAPNTEYFARPLGDILPIARDKTTQEIRGVLPNFIRAPLIGLTEGPQTINGQFKTPAATINPETNSLGITPEAASVAGLAASPLRIGPLGPVPAGLAAREAPLSPEFQRNALAPPAAAKIAEMQPANTMTVKPSAPVATPRTVAEAKSVADAYYDVADKAGGAQFPPGLANEIISTVKKVAPQTTEGRIFAGETEISKLSRSVEGLRDRPITLRGAQEIDEGLGGLIDNQWTVKGLTKEGRNLMDLQFKLREMVVNTEPAGATGAGVEALKQGRLAWSQAQKMADLERIQERASLQDYPSTGVRAGIRALLANPARRRGYSEAEIKALRQAAERGVIGGALHVFGSRLIPIGAGIAGASTGPISGLAAAGLTHAGTTAIRGMETGLTNRRVNNALGVLGSRVPPPP